MLFVISNDGEDEYIRVSPHVARIVMSGFKKELTYWSYKLSTYRKNTPKKATAERLNMLSKLERRVAFYSARITELENGIYNCEYQKSKCN